MKCDKCSREAVIYQPYSGMHLCSWHFTRSVESRAKREINTHRWIRSGDLIGVALSGGKDSAALLHFLSGLTGRRRDVSLLAITIDEGIAGYRDPAVARRIAGAEGVEWHCRSFEEIFGVTLDGVVAQVGERRSCSYCGLLRRAALNRAARELGVTRLALGFTLDDEAQTVLMNVLRGDADRLLRPRDRELPGVVQRIRPFRTVPEREVALYAHLHTTGFDLRGCPYAGAALRNDVRRLLDGYTHRHPSTPFALLRLEERLQQAAPVEREVPVCPRCHEPAPGGCRLCRILEEVGGHP
ncbi:MAG: TIGR00269 family protein [Methanoculleaceae archaeon]